jgi:DNA-binding NtrC family response regulator
MLSGCRVLLVEDEALVAEHITDVLTEAEADVVGPLATVAEARQLVRDGVKVTAALLDLNLRDGSATPLIEALTARGIPTVVYTGAGLPDEVRRRHPELVALMKPVPPARLVAEIRRATRDDPKKPVN